MKFLFYLTLLFISSIFSEDKSSYEEENKKNTEFVNENRKIINEKKDRVNELESQKKERREEPDFLVEGRKSNFLVLGGSIGTPASGNLNVGYYFDRFVIRGSGMYYTSKWNGIQGDLGYSFYKTKEVIMGLSLNLGRYTVNPFNPQVGSGGQNLYQDSSAFPGYQNSSPTYVDGFIRKYIAEQNPNLAFALDYYYRDRQYQTFTQNYIGLSYDLYLDGFFLQLGAGVGRGTYRDPQLLVQFGYLFDFGKNK